MGVGKTGARGHWGRAGRKRVHSNDSGSWRGEAGTDLRDLQEAEYTGLPSHALGRAGKRQQSRTTELSSLGGPGDRNAPLWSRESRRRGSRKGGSECPQASEAEDCGAATASSLWGGLSKPALDTAGLGPGALTPT